MVVVLLSSYPPPYPLDLWTVMNCGRRDRADMADPVQSNFIISEVIVIVFLL